MALIETLRNDIYRARSGSIDLLCHFGRINVFGKPGQFYIDGEKRHRKGKNAIAQTNDAVKVRIALGVEVN